MSEEPSSLANIWNRLPVFRVVAATQHLPTASKILHITAPAISRTIRLLEEDLGQPLFRRIGRNLALNSAGQRLFHALTDTMQSLDGTIRELSDDPLSGSVRVSALGVLTDYFVVPAMLELQRLHPNLSPDLRLHSTVDANLLLMRSQIDVAFYYEGLSNDQLSIEEIGHTTAGIYCGETHPLFDAPPPTLETLCTYPFSVPQEGDNGRTQDGWPIDLPREVGMRITTLSSNHRIGLSGRFLTVLPDVVAQADRIAGRLKRLPHDVIPKIEIFAARRKTDEVGSAAESVVEAVRQEVARHAA